MQMRTTAIAMLLSVGAGFVQISASSALPLGGSAIGDAAGTSLLQRVEAGGMGGGGMGGGGMGGGGVSGGGMGGAAVSGGGMGGASYRAGRAGWVGTNDARWYGAGQRHYWHGTWYEYGVGSCWAWSNTYNGYVWTCGD